MGGGVSVFQGSRQETINNITQISRANCLNTCLNNQKINASFVNSVINGNINFSEICLIEGASCILKSSLDNSILNDQSAKLKSSIEREVDLFSFMGGFTQDDITQDNVQKIVNDITQMIESTCQNKAESNGGSINLDYRGVTVNGDINLTDEKSITNSKCTIENMVKNYVENKQSADLEADVKIKGSLGSIIMFLVLIVIIYVLVKGEGGGAVSSVIKGIRGDNKQKNSKSGTSTNRERIN